MAAMMAVMVIVSFAVLLEELMFFAARGTRISRLMRKADAIQRQLDSMKRML